jgi:thioredoxin 1
MGVKDMGVPEVNGVNFETEVLQSSSPVLVDFWAPWCGPCRRIAPLIEELYNENKGSAKVVKINTDESQELAMQYGIEAIPTLMIFKDGEVVERLGSIPPKSRIQEALNAAM